MNLAIYCDESCHLEHDKSNVMGFGAVWADKKAVRRVCLELRDIKRRHHASGELKWTKVSASKLAFYFELIEWFFANNELHFRALIVPNKAVLNHEKFNQGSHDDFYYKMYFSLLSKILTPTDKNEIYLDIKDTRSKFKVQKLKDVLCNDKYDFTGELIAKIQHARSHELELMQLADFLLGAVVYCHRGLDTSDAKRQVIQRIEALAHRSLLRSTALGYQKFNLFVWRAQAA